MVLKFLCSGETPENKANIIQGNMSKLMVLELNLYPLRRKAVFPKSVNTDSLPVYVIPFKSYWSAYYKIISVAMKDVVILREISLKHKNEKIEKCASRLMS